MDGMACWDLLNKLHMNIVYNIASRSGKINLKYDIWLMFEKIVATMTESIVYIKNGGQ